VASAEIKRHWDRVAALGCIITGRPATIAHCHGGSMKDCGLHVGVAQKQSDWLVIPLSKELHQGQYGLDTWGDGVRAWESYWGKTQIELLQEVSARLGYDVFERAGVRLATAPVRSL